MPGTVTKSRQSGTGTADPRGLGGACGEPSGLAAARIPATDQELFARSVPAAVSVYLPAAVASRALGFLRAVVLTWLMPPGEYGVLGLLLLTVAWAAPVASLGLSESLARYVPAWQASGRLASRLIQQLLWALSLTAGFAVVFAWLGPAVFPGGLGGGQRDLWALAGLALWCQVAYLLVIAVLKGMRLFGALAASELLGGAGFAALAISLAAAGYPTARVVAWTFAVSSLAAAAWAGTAIWRALRQGRQPTSSPEPAASPEDTGRAAASAAWRFGIWAAAAAVAWQWLHYWPLAYLQAVAGNDAAGHFAAARQLAQPVAVAGTAAVAVIAAHAARLWELGRRDEAEALWEYWMIVAGGLLVALAVVLSMLRGVAVALLGPEYARAVEALPGLLWFFSLCSLIGFAAVHFALLERNWLMLPAWCAGLAAAVFASGLFVTRAQSAEAVAGAAWVSAIGMLAATVALLALLIWTGWRPRPATLLVLLGSVGTVVPSPWQPAFVVLLVGTAASRGGLLRGWTAASSSRRRA